MKVHGMKSYIGLAMLLVASTAAAQSAIDPGLPPFTMVSSLPFRHPTALGGL